MCVIQVCVGAMFDGDTLQQTITYPPSFAMIASLGGATPHHVEDCFCHHELLQPGGNSHHEQLVQPLSIMSYSQCFFTPLHHRPSGQPQVQ